MKIRSLAFAIAAAFLMLGRAQAEPKLRVAVLEFTEKDAGRWSGHVGKAAEDWFVDSLVNVQKFHVMERQQLQNVLAEHAMRTERQADSIRRFIGSPEQMNCGAGCKPVPLY